MNLEQNIQKQGLDSLRTEIELKKHWPSADAEPLVSVVCMCYNHEDYIEETLCSFFIQETSFSFEVLVHDDASTDRSAAIISRFQARYPSIIRTIYQNDNQYSQGRPQGSETREKCRGRYIAMCEGDDYWIYANKLQRQFDVLEARPEVSMCFHAAYQEDMKSGNHLEKICMHSTNDCYISLKQMILGGGGYCPTNSLFFRKDAVSNMPKFMRECPVGDAAIQLACAIYGRIYYLPLAMSVYRLNVSGSWTDRMRLDCIARLKHAAQILSFYRDLNIYLEDKYKYIIRAKVIRNLFLEGVSLGTSGVAYQVIYSELRRVQLGICPGKILIFIGVVFGSMRQKIR